ncbi:hypothetical protein LCGC14_0746780 [marine sediment metagenome]|jgi:hypothetical protein|uniref:Uncharacterized protein n=1 Tax=marine sediment metagenome TaxID=412755 RepID=A0A0F9SQ78_9ZZZZ
MSTKIEEERMEGLDNKMDSYKEIREALAGVSEILNINFSKKDFYYLAAMDNLQAIHDNILDILEEINPREFRKRLRDLEFDEAEIEKNFPF